MLIVSYIIITIILKQERKIAVTRAACEPW